MFRMVEQITTPAGERLEGERDGSDLVLTAWGPSHDFAPGDRVHLDGDRVIGVTPAPLWVYEIHVTTPESYVRFEDGTFGTPATVLDDISWEMSELLADDVEKRLRQLATLVHRGTRLTVTVGLIEEELATGAFDEFLAQLTQSGNGNLYEVWRQPGMDLRSWLTEKGGVVPLDTVSLRLGEER